tara:strand:+ start:275 stop:571 length:297 start_codon:yes stop_codon:yes gene_type:complete
MISFLRSILWGKPDKTEALLESLNLAYKKIEQLEEDVVSLKQGVGELSVCVQNTTMVMHSLAQELLILADFAQKSSGSFREADALSLMTDNDDDGLLN